MRLQWGLVMKTMRNLPPLSEFEFGIYKRSCWSCQCPHPLYSYHVCPQQKQHPHSHDYHPVQRLDEASNSRAQCQNRQWDWGCRGEGRWTKIAQAGEVGRAGECVHSPLPNNCHNSPVTVSQSEGLGQKNNHNQHNKGLRKGEWWCASVVPEGKSLMGKGMLLHQRDDADADRGHSWHPGVIEVDGNGCLEPS